MTADAVFEADTTLYAHWSSTGGDGEVEDAFFTLTFETNGGSAAASRRFRAGTTVDLANYTPSRGGYTFTGWYADKALTGKITGIRLDGDRTVYAGWQRTVAVRSSSAPQTGDRSSLGLWSFTLCAALTASLALTAARLRRRKDDTL